MSQNFAEGNVPLAVDPRRSLLVKQLNLLNAIAGEGGSGGSGAPDSIAIPGPPSAIPPALQNIIVDSNGRQWMYYGGAWH